MGKVRKVLEEEAKAKIKCSYGICLNLKLRHELSKKAKKIAKDIDEVLENGGFDKVSNMDYMSFNSRMSTLNGLMVALGDVNINMIGVWGMPGAGKTTLVREVVWQAKKEKLFDEVAMATVMQSPDLRQIQGEIADMLDLKFDDVETVPGRAIRLRERLKGNKKVLVILDDIWNKLDLEAIGIPCNGCKILLTSRDRDILSCVMNTQKKFELDVLSPDEAWSLFEKMAGDSLKDPNLRSIATQVAQVCAGLPLAIVTVATALKNKSLFEWEDALQQLRRPSPVHLTGMQAAIYSKIELSYKHLGSPVVKSFFLLSGQMSSTIFYKDLVKYCFGLCLFPGILTLEEARNKVYTLVRNLKDSCLLLEDPHTREYVRMHDLVRDVAILIAKAENMFSMRNDDPVKWPDEDALKMCTSISVLARDIHELPDGLVYIAVIGELKNLEILSLIHSEFTELPQEIGLLTHLRLLDLSYCTKLEVIPPNVLSNLKQLEELYVRDSFAQWELEGVNNERASLAELKHLSLLTTLEVNIPNANMLPKNLLFKKLKRYQIFIGDVWDQFGKSESSRALKLKLNSSFELEQGIKMLLSGIEELCLDELKGVKSIISELDSKGFQQLKHLHVQNNSEMKYIILSKGLGIADVVFPVLEIFSLKNMINLEEICHGQIPLTSFRNLSIVKVEHCEKLKFVFSSSIAKSLSQLQTLEIRECSIMGAIVEKEEGRIEDTDMKLFPQLRRLLLHCLPKLVSFLSTQNSGIIDAGEVIPESELNFSLPILHKQVVFPNLETLELSSIHSEEILLHNQHRANSSFKLTDPRFQNLYKLNVKGSGNLKYLLSSATATFMVQLKYLDIEDCKVMEEVLLTEDLGEQIIPKVLFPRLEHLNLKDLPVLKRFCIGTNLRFPSLKDLWIEQCPKLESFIFKSVSSGMTLSKEIKEVNSEEISQTAIQPLFNEEVAFPSLETMRILHLENLKIIWHDQLAEDSFFKLQSLFVEYCENLVNIFESNILTRFQSLERLYVEYCGSLQEVFELQRHNVRESHAVTAIPLKSLILRRLPKMKQVWNKDPQGIFSFQNLQEISVWECESLQSLFPASVARFLMQLEDLRIEDCGVKEIVSREEIAKAAARFVFPKVTLLVLRKLPKLKWFCRGLHTSEWPLLKKLEVRACDQVEIFTSKILNFQETIEQSQLETSIQQPLFLVEEGTLFPNLEVLTLSGDFMMKEIQRDQLLEESFYKLKVLSIAGYLAVSDWMNFLKRLHSLEELFVRLTSWEEIFPYEELFDQENNATILTKLRELELYELPTLTHLWKEDTQPSPILYNLENLIVSFCDKLKILVPSSISFQNLTNLELLKCHGLLNLVTSSTAKSLVQLKKMIVSECERITEVVVGEGGEASEVITFTQLIYLKLDSLPNLASFCSESYSFNFPSLEEVIVRQCPEMKTFSYGALGTPKLKKVQATQEDEWHWKVDLNTTIHWLT
ncbi:disease resistance protein At4g27190-like [Quercus lobata]|uniref:disease resistance protein At4g27190-like n=1 Tax=Quercus lobata TaxID=97700 RepID=UPI0012467E97|nr:disease resistance protein At4g27190-like [Quercus lobata]